VAAASQILTKSVSGSVADDLLAKGIQDVRAKLN
jgi:F-type H+-transporting ATPase subunit b